MTEPRRHIWIPDTQVKAGVPRDHIRWAAQAIVDYMPDVIHVAGDWADCPAFTRHAAPGSLELEGARYVDDINVANESFAEFIAPMVAERERRRRNHRPRWEPECHFYKGNHEDQIDRAVRQDARLEGLLSSDAFQTPGFTRHEFLEIVEVDGIWFSHYFANTQSGRAIGGSIDNRLNRVGNSFVMGHQQGFLYGVRQYPGNVQRHGLVAGSFYLHNPEYRGRQGNGEWRGIVVLNEVRNGTYDIMPLSMNYLRRKYS